MVPFTFIRFKVLIVTGQTSRGTTRLGHYGVKTPYGHHNLDTIRDSKINVSTVSKISNYQLRTDHIFEINRTTRSEYLEV